MQIKEAQKESKPIKTTLLPASDKEEFRKRSLFEVIYPPHEAILQEKKIFDETFNSKYEGSNSIYSTLEWLNTWRPIQR